MNQADWKLSVTDNGISKGLRTAETPSSGLATAIVTALARRLQAQIYETSTADGLCIDIMRAAFAAQIPKVA